MASCILVPCTDTGTVAKYQGAYSIDSALQYTNGIISYGGTTVPAGAYQVNLNPPVSGGVVASDYSVSMQGCQSTVSTTIPAGTPTSGIQGYMNQLFQLLAQQQAACNSTPPVNTYSNTAVQAGCPNGKTMSVTGTLPPGITFNGSQLVAAPGLFASSVSVADANQKALTLLLSLIANPAIISCGNPFCGSLPTTLADLVWVLHDPNPPGVTLAGSGSTVVGTANIPGGTTFYNAIDALFCNPTSNDILITANTVATISGASTVTQIGFAAFLIPSGGGGCLTYNQSDPLPPIVTPCQLTVPALSYGSLEIQFQATSGATDLIISMTTTLSI